MADAVSLPALTIRASEAPDCPRYSALVRVTHWITALSFFGLLVSGVAILLAHPRLYWGETGAVGTSALIDLPLPFVLTGQTGWGRYLHFLSAWICILNGLLYVLSGLRTGHVRQHLLPARRDLSWSAISRVVLGRLRLETTAEDVPSYNVVQQLAYLAVVFAVFPLMIWSGLAMSPAITSVFHGVVNALGGQQSARTIHFFAACLLVVFLLVHIRMVWRAGFTSRIRLMITGRSRAGGTGR